MFRLYRSLARNPLTSSNQTAKFYHTQGQRAKVSAHSVTRTPINLAPINPNGVSMNSQALLNQLTCSMQEPNDDHYKYFGVIVRLIENGEALPLMNAIKKAMPGSQDSVRKHFNFAKNIAQVDKYITYRMKSLNSPYYNHVIFKQLLCREEGVQSLLAQSLHTVSARRNELVVEEMNYEDYLSETPAALEKKLMKLLALPQHMHCLDEKGNPVLSLDTISNNAKIFAILRILKSYQVVFVHNRGIVGEEIAKAARKNGWLVAAACLPDDINSPLAQLAHWVIPFNKLDDEKEFAQKIKEFSAGLPDGIRMGIHPGYGYLSEEKNAAKICKELGQVFIGPDEESMFALGDKAQARLTATRAGVPVIPGYDGESQDEKVLMAEAEKLGFPVMLKTTGGGGGTGNREAHNAEEFIAKLAELTGRGHKVILEKFIGTNSKTKHIEIQIASDGETSVVINSRDCSTQRYHQKIGHIGINPWNTATATDYPMLDKLEQDALRIHKLVPKYKGLATYEFMVDEEGNYFFLECNTRLQVEHGVSEEVASDIDLVELQLHIANDGTILSYLQKWFKDNDHACDGLSAEEMIKFLHSNSPYIYSIQFRINGQKLIYEPESKKLMNDTTEGEIKVLNLPPADAATVIEMGIRLGDKINTLKFNSMLGLISVRGADYKKIWLDLIKVLKNTTIEGIETNINYLIFAAECFSLLPPAKLNTSICNRVDALYAQNLPATEILKPEIVIECSQEPVEERSSQRRLM